MRRVHLAAVAVLLALVFATPGAPLVAGGDARAADHTVHRLAHDVEVEPGVTLRVIEAWTDDWIPGRALLAIAPTLVTHKVWDADVPGDPTYSALHLAALQGYRAYAFDHWGYGDSSQPENGMDVMAERMLVQTGTLLEWVRARTGADQVQLLSGSLGNSIAFALGGVASPIDPAHVGAIVATANVYANASLVLSLTILNPLVCNLLPPPPDGYTQTLAPLYAIILWNAELEAQLWAYQEFPGRYAQGPTQEGCDLPVFPAADGRAPILVAYGDHDLLTDPADVDQFAAEYGGPVELLFLPGGGHAPPFESVRHDFWAAAFAWYEANGS